MSDTGGNGGYIRLHRQILKWEWWNNPNTFRLFLYLLLKANYCDLRFEGKVIRRGQLITSLPKLAKETSLSVQQVRTSLLKLISTGEITDSSTRHYRIITIVKYDEYQNDNRQDNRQITDNQQTDNRQITVSKEIKKDNKDKKENNNKPLKRFVPPTIEEIEQYCHERENHVSAERFFDYYEAVGWTYGKGGKPIKDWKAAVRTWEHREQTERDYQNDHDLRGLPL